MARFERKIEAVKARHDAGSITRARLQKSMMEHESKIRQLKARIQTYRGAIGKERRRLEKDSG